MYSTLNASLIKVVNPDVIDLHCILLCLGVPGREPIVSRLPKFTHFRWAVVGPWFTEWIVDATIRKEIASDSHV